MDSPLTDPIGIARASLPIDTRQSPGNNTPDRLAGLSVGAQSPKRRSGAEDHLEFTGALGGSIKPFCPTQASIDPGHPYIISLDGMIFELIGRAIDCAAIHARDSNPRPNQSPDPPPAPIIPAAGQEARQTPSRIIATLTEPMDTGRIQTTIAVTLCSDSRVAPPSFADRS